jgi:hypothetical protein
MTGLPEKREQTQRVLTGEAAWKAAKARVEARNDQAYKAGKERRAAAEERRRSDVRSAELRERAELEGRERRRAGS